MARVYTEAELAHIALVQKHVRPGDVLTHRRCMGRLQEHVYTGRDGIGLCGKPTPDTKRFDGERYEVNDIHPVNVTHINRDPVAAIPALIEIDPKWKARADGK